MSFLSSLYSEFTDVPQKIIHSDQDAQCAQLHFASVSRDVSHQWWVLSLIETQMPENRCTQFDSLPFPRSHPSPFCLLPLSLPLSFLSYVPCFAHYFHSDSWMEIMATVFSIYDFFVGLISKDWHLQKKTCWWLLPYSTLFISFSILHLMQSFSPDCIN